MVSKKNKSAALLCALLTISGLTALAPSAQAGFLGKLTKAAIYPVRKLGSNTSVDTHRVLQKDSVDKSNSPTSPNQVVKPDGHKVPVSGS